MKRIIVLLHRAADAPEATAAGRLKRLSGLAPRLTNEHPEDIHTLTICMLIIMHIFSIMLVIQIVKRGEQKMGYSQAQKAESRQRVLETAARQIREDGIDALGVADCMRSAGLTHGAFYGHFDSRDALIVEALEYAVAQSKQRIDALHTGAGGSKAKEPLRAIAEAFLSDRHIKNPGSGCALCALAGEARHASPAIRERLTGYVHTLAAQIAQKLAGQSESAALGIVATIVGAVTLARAVDDKQLAKSILSASLELIVAQGGDAG